MKPLSGLDAAFLYLETPETPMHVGSLHLYQVPPRQRATFYDRAVKHIASRIHLAPGETRTVRIPLKAQQLAYWDTSRKAFVVEQEPVRLMIGASSADVRLRAEIAVE